MAPETTAGTPAAAPLYWIPVDSPQWHPIQPAMKDNAMRGSMNTEFGQLLGIRHDELSLKTFFYLDSIYFLLRCALGVPDVKTGAGPYIHKTSVRSDNNGQPQTTTIWYYDPSSGQTWQMAGCQTVDTKVTLNESALASLDQNWMGMPATVVTAPSNTPTTNPPMPSWNTTLTIAGAANVLMSSLEIDIKRATISVDTVTGTQAPLSIYAGEVSVSGSMTSVYQGSTDVNLADYLVNTQPAFVAKVAPQGDAVDFISFQCTKVAYDDVQPSGQGKYMEVKSTLSMIANATDVAAGGNVSSILVTCTNSVATTI
jgi:hypothetical protein